MESKNNEKMETKYFIIMIIIFLILWRVPLLFLDLGIIFAGLLPVIAFIIAHYFIKIIIKIRKIKRYPNQTKRKRI